MKKCAFCEAGAKRTFLSFLGNVVVMIMMMVVSKNIIIIISY